MLHRLPLFGLALLFLVLLIVAGALIGGAIYFHGVVKNVNFIDNDEGQEANIKKVAIKRIVDQTDFLFCICSPFIYAISF